MGDPAVVFTTYKGDSDFATTNVSGHAANSTQSPFVELKSDLVPQAEKFSNGDHQVSDFDTIRTITTEVTHKRHSNGQAYTDGTHEDTTYSTRGTLGTFALKGGQFELCEFDAGTKGSSIADHISKSGVSHNYVAFANTGDGDGLTHHANGSLNVTASVVSGPPTAYAPDKPFANIEYDVSHTSTPLQAIAGGGSEEANTYAGIYISGRSDSGTESPAYFWDIKNVSARTQANVTRTILDTISETDGDTGLVTINYVNRSNTTNLIIENWYPQASYSPSTTSASLHQGTIQFQVHPDSEYVMTENMTTTNVAIDSVTIAANSAIGPIATHSRITVTTDDDHGLTDEQNQIVITGCHTPSHINGIHNVHSVSNTTVFDYMITKSTVASGQTCEGTIKLQTYDGIDKTGAVIKTSSDGSGAGIAEVVHGGCGGNNIVLLRGDTSSNISLGTQYYVYADNSATDSIASVKFTSGPTYKSMFKEMGLVLDRDTGQISSNGSFSGGLATNTITAGGYITLEDGSPKSFGTEFILQEDTLEGKIETEDLVRIVTFPDSGLNELDSYFYKFKHARDYALNRVKNDGTITQSGDVVTIQGVDDSTDFGSSYSNRISLEDGFGAVITESVGNMIELETRSQTFPSKTVENLPSPVRFKTLQYQNGFTTNVSYSTSNSTFIVQSNTEIGFIEGTADGEDYELTYADTSWPVTNSSSYWFMNNIENSPVVDDDSNILIFKTTSESTNFKVHFTIRAQKIHAQMGGYTGSQGTSTAASVLNSIEGWGNPFETGSGNYYDGYFYVSVYNNTDSDRDDQVVVFSDQNNASSTTLDFNGNAFKHRDDPDDPDTEISILNEESLANAYSNGDFTLLTSV